MHSLPRNFRGGRHDKFSDRHCRCICCHRSRVLFCRHDTHPVLTTFLLNATVKVGEILRPPTDTQSCLDPVTEQTPASAGAFFLAGRIQLNATRAAPTNARAAADRMLIERVASRSIAALLGHSQPATTSRYSHLHDDAQRAATNRVGPIMAAHENPSSAEVIPISGRRS